MSIISAFVFDRRKVGSLLFSRQFCNITQSRLEVMLTAFPKLLQLHKNSLCIETSELIYHYQNVSNEILIGLITSKCVSHPQITELLTLIGNTCSEICKVPLHGLTPDNITENTIELIMGVDEIIQEGYIDIMTSTVEQITTCLTMDSHEEYRWRVFQQEKMYETRLKSKQKARELDAKRAGTGIDGQDGHSTLNDPSLEGRIVGMGSGALPSSHKSNNYHVEADNDQFSQDQSSSSSHDILGQNESSSSSATAATTTASSSSTSSLTASSTIPKAVLPDFGESNNNSTIKPNMTSLTSGGKALPKFGSRMNLGKKGKQSTALHSKELQLAAVAAVTNPELYPPNSSTTTTHDDENEEASLPEISKQHELQIQQNHYQQQQQQQQQPPSTPPSHSPPPLYLDISTPLTSLELHFDERITFSLDASGVAKYVNIQGKLLFLLPPSKSNSQPPRYAVQLNPGTLQIYPHLIKAQIRPGYDRNAWNSQFLISPASNTPANRDILTIGRERPNTLIQWRAQCTGDDAEQLLPFLVTLWVTGTDNMTNASVSVTWTRTTFQTSINRVMLAIPCHVEPTVSLSSAPWKYHHGNKLLLININDLSQEVGECSFDVDCSRNVCSQEDDEPLQQLFLPMQLKCVTPVENRKSYLGLEIAQVVDLHNNTPVPFESESHVTFPQSCVE